MDWTVAGSAFAGSIISVILLTAIVVVWVYFDDRHKANPEPVKIQKTRTLHDDILERHLEELIVANFGQLFSGWSIYQLESQENNGTRQSAIRYRTTAGEIDLLCTDEDNNFVVIELKRNRTPDQVLTQVDRYIAWVEKNLAQPGQKARGIIIAKKHSDHVVYSASRKEDIELWTYDLNLSLQPLSPKVG